MFIPRVPCSCAALSTSGGYVRIERSPRSSRASAGASHNDLLLPFRKPANKCACTLFCTGSHSHLVCKFPKDLLQWIVESSPCLRLHCHAALEGFVAEYGRARQIDNFRPYSGSELVLRILIYHVNPVSLVATFILLLPSLISLQDAWISCSQRPIPGHTCICSGRSQAGFHSLLD